MKEEHINIKFQKTLTKDQYDLFFERKEWFQKDCCRMFSKITVEDIIQDLQTKYKVESD